MEARAMDRSIRRYRVKSGLRSVAIVHRAERRSHGKRIWLLRSVSLALGAQVRKAADTSEAHGEAVALKGGGLDMRASEAREICWINKKGSQ